MDAGGNGLTFAFDRVFDMESTQEELYEFTAKPVVESKTVIEYNTKMIKVYWKDLMVQYLPMVKLLQEKHTL
jgi:hypothetical protein